MCHRMEALMGSWSRWRMQALRGQNGIMQTVSLRSDQKHECTFRRFRWLPVSVRSSPQIISCQAQTSDTVLGPLRWHKGFAWSLSSVSTSL